MAEQTRLATDSLRRDKKIGSYLVGNVIGKGGFGSVYKALDQQRAHFVAIKQLSVHGLGGAPGPRSGREVGHGVLSSGDLGSIEMEISLLSKLRHRNIVKYIDSIRTEHHLNIVLEYVEGGSLASILKKFGAFPESLCAIYTLQILKGLKYLHSQGVIHRDIKGANVLTTKTGLVKLADFGVATKLSEVDSSKRRVVGTPYWMAPEIVEMSTPTPACDIWSVGSTVVEMVTEKPPYADLQQVSALYRIVSDPHPPVPECVSRSLELFLLNCFVKDPLRRASAGEMIEDDWIVTNKKHTMDFNRKMKSPAVEPAQDDEPDEEPDEELELMGTITTFIGSITGHPGRPERGAAAPDAEYVEEDPGALLADISPRDPRTPSKRSSSGEVRREAATEAAATDTAQGEQAGAEAEAQDLRASGAADAAEAQVQDAVENGSATATTAVVASAALEAAVVAREEHRSISDSTNNEYHFAFLDYFNKHYAAATSVERSVPADATIATAEEEDRHASTDFFGRTTLLGAQLGLEEVAAAESPARAPGTVPAAGAAGPRQTGHTPALNGSSTPPPPPPLSSGGATPLGRTERFTSDPSPIVHGKERQRDAAEIRQLLGSIRPFEESGVLVGVCKRLTELLQQGNSKDGDNNSHLVMQHGAVPIVEMLQVTDPTLLRTVLRVINQIVDGNQAFQEMFAMVGLIPGVIKFARPHHSRPLRYEAACFIFCLCNTSPRSLQMLVACGGLEALVDLLSHDYYHNRDLVWLALDALSKVFDGASIFEGTTARSNQNSDFCRILAKHGLCGHLCLLVDTLAGDIHERASHYLEVVVNLLLFFAKEGDAVVKVYMAKGSVLEGLITALEFLPPNLAVQTCKTFKWLAQEPSVLNMLENAGVVPVLAHFLSSFCGPGARAEVDEESAASSLQAQDACSQCLLALFYLCKLSRPRQEQAALAGAVPLLQDLVGKRHNLRVYAFVMLCDMTSSSLATRRILWSQGGVAFLVRCLSEPELQTFALEALVGWLGVREHRADWSGRLEEVLLMDESFLKNLLVLFKSERPTVFLKSLDPLLKLVRVSKQINAALAGCDEFFVELVQRLRSGRQPGPAETTASPGSSTSTVAACGTLGSGALLQPSTDPDSPQRLSGSGTTLPTAATCVRRLVSGPAPVADDAVRARTYLLRLLLLLCQAQKKEQLAALCQVYRLEALMHHVLLEEKRSKRVILCEIASQLVELFHRVLPTDANNTI